MELKIKDVVLIQSSRDSKIDGKVGVVVGFDDKDARLGVKVVIGEDTVVFLNKNQLTTLIQSRIDIEDKILKYERKRIGTIIKNRRLNMRVPLKKIHSVAGIEPERLHLLENGNIFLTDELQAKRLTWLLTGATGKSPFEWVDLMEK